MFLYLADEVKKHTNLPVCGVGKLSSPDFIESIISNNRVDMISMSRQLLADSNWLQKVKDGRVDEIKNAVIVIKVCRCLADTFSIWMYLRLNCVCRNKKSVNIFLVS